MRLSVLGYHIAFLNCSSFGVYCLNRGPFLAPPVPETAWRSAHSAPPSEAAPETRQDIFARRRASFRSSNPSSSPCKAAHVRPTCLTFSSQIICYDPLYLLVLAGFFQGHRHFGADGTSGFVTLCIAKEWCPMRPKMPRHPDRAGPGSPSARLSRNEVPEP